MPSRDKKVEVDSQVLNGYLVHSQEVLNYIYTIVEMQPLGGKFKDFLLTNIQAVKDAVLDSQNLLIP